MSYKRSLRYGMSGFLIASMVCMQGCLWSSSKRTTSLDINSALQKDTIVPLLIIGSGPAGLTAGIYGIRGMVKTVIIQGTEPGGLLTKTTEIENWPGEGKILGPTLINQMRDHAEKLGVEFLADTVTSIDLSQWPYTVRTEEGLTIHALSIILATGATPRMLGVPGEQDYFHGKGVSTCAVCDAPFTKGEEVLVVGGGDSAIEESIQLAPYAKNVTLLVRKESMRAAPRMQERLKQYPNISVRYNIAIEKVEGNEERMTGVQAINTKTNEQETIPATRLFLAIGHDPNSQLVKGSLAMDEQGYVETVGKTQVTSVSGVFAAGEVEDNHYRQAIVAAGRGAGAALDALAFLSDVGFNPTIAASMKLFTVQVTKKKDLINLKSMQDFNERAREGFVVLDFYTNTCPSCLQMIPTVEAVAANYDQKVEFFKVDADEAVDLVKKFFVYKVPALVVLHNGKLVARYNDVMNKQELTDFVEQFLQKSH